MISSLKTILEIQELDMKMLRLMKLKRERQKELNHIESLRTDLTNQLSEKQEDLIEIKKNIDLHEIKIEEIKEKIKKLDAKQSTIKKVEEFNALTQEMSTAERERHATEQATSDLIDKKNLEEEVLEKIKQSLSSTEDSTKELKKEIYSSIELINKEGRELKIQRDQLAATANQDILRIYDRLFKNKKDRVVVPIEARTCSGCHIALTAQHENLVRKGERMVFCEHCSRILYWQDSQNLEGTTLAPKRRRRRAVQST